MKIHRSIALAASLMIAALVASAGPTWAQEGSAPCSNRTLQGDYAFSIEGAAPPVAIRGVAMTHFDGQGNLTQVDHVVVNGVVPAMEWRQGTGTYSVNADCTGKAELLNPARPAVTLYFVIVGNGAEIRTVVSTPGAISSSVGTKRN